MHTIRKVKTLCTQFNTITQSYSIVMADLESTNAELDDNVPTAEEATEATEVGDISTDDVADIQAGIYTEHVFTDPLGVQNTTDDSGCQPK